MVISQVKVKFANNEREFFVSRSVAMMKISLPSGAVKVEGRMTKEITPLLKTKRTSRKDLN